MINVLELAADVKLEPEGLERTMAELAVKGRHPATHEARKQFWSLASAATKQAKRTTAPSPLARGVGDIFFASEQDLFFVLAQGTSNQGRFVIDIDGEAKPSLRIGLITTSSDGSSNRLEEFAQHVEEAILRAVDGRKTRHMDFQWRSPERPPLIQRLREGEDGDLDGVRFADAELSEAITRGSETLANPEARRVLIQLSQARIAQADDLWKGRPRGQRSRIEAALQELEKAGLVEVTKLIRCPKAVDPLMQLRDDAEVLAVKEILHPACGKVYGDHDLTPAYSISEAGRELAQASHWMTVWVTDKLVALGVPLDEIAWALVSGPEEIDIAVSFLDELWIFELKDREFGVGDALPFNYRHRVRYQAQQAVVITTEQISPDAHRVLDEMAREAQRAASGGWFRSSEVEVSKPVLIEGLDKVAKQLRESFEKAAAKAAARRLLELERDTGFPVMAAAEIRLGPLPKPAPMDEIPF